MAWSGETRDGWNDRFWTAWQRSQAGLPPKYPSGQRTIAITLAQFCEALAITGTVTNIRLGGSAVIITVQDEEPGYGHGV